MTGPALNCLLVASPDEARIAQGTEAALVFENVSRRRQGLIEEILGHFVELPFWMSVIGAAFFFLALYFVLPPTAGSSLIGKAFAGLGPTVAPWVSAAVITAGLIGVAKRRWKGYLFSRAAGPKGFANFTWQDFELIVGETYRRQGYRVVERGGKHPNGGVDLEVHRGSEKLIIQCKYWVNRQVPVQRVRELLGVLTAEGADRGILIATGGFTSEARAFAAGQPIELIDGQAFAAMAQSVSGNGQRPSIDAVIAVNDRPSCPQCGKAMVLRAAKRGANAGAAFWGCASYPACRGTRAA